MLKIYDLTGKKFGDLIVLGKDLEAAQQRNTSTHKRIYWKCKCLLCGSECSYTTSKLLNSYKGQKAASCCPECAQIKASKTRRMDITGQTFGELKALSLNEELSTKKRKRWNCVCLRCGRECVKLLDDLRSGKVTRCNNCSLADRIESSTIHMTGNRYGRLVVLDEFKDESGKKKIKCSCDCGNVIILNRADVLSKHTESCGCLQRERASKSNTKDQSNTITESGIKILSPFTQTDRGVWIYECLCPLCNNKFLEIPARVKDGHVKSCGCGKRSTPESYIESILREMNVLFIREFRFKDCYYKSIDSPLRFDLILYNSNYSISGAIEYDGYQHFKFVPFYHENIEGFHELQNRDKRKNEYCEKHNIPLLRLNYQMTNSQMYEEIKNFVSINSIDCGVL